MWSQSIEILNPYEAICESLEKERARNAVPVLKRSTFLTRLCRRIRGLLP